jgi:hypothetical protein
MRRFQPAATSVRFRRVPAFTASLINSRKSESDPLRTFRPKNASTTAWLELVSSTLCWLPIMGTGRQCSRLRNGWKR